MNREMKCITCAVGLLALLAGGLAGAAGKSNKITVIRDARVHTMGPAGTLPRATVVIIDDKIAGVGQSVKALSIGGSAPIVDGRGLDVYPGMIDAWSNLGLVEVAAVPATNDSVEPGDYRPQLLAFSAIHVESEHIPVARANGVTASVSVPAGSTVSGQATLIHLDGWTTDQMAILKSAGLVIEFPSLEARGRTGGASSQGAVREPFSETKKAYERQVRDLSELLEQARHYDKARSANPSTSRDAKLEALLPAVNRRLPVFLHAESARDIRNAVEFAKREGLRAVIRGGRDADKAAELLKKESVPVILDSIVRLPAREDDPYDRPFTVPRDLAKAGVKFALTSPMSADVRNLPYEAGVAEAYGLSHLDALRAITLAPAEILGVADRLGSIEAGKIADLVVTDGDILELRTKVKYVFIAGRSVSLENRHTRLYREYLARP